MGLTTVQCDCAACDRIHGKPTVMVKNKDTTNIQIGITSFAYKKLTIFHSVVVFSGSANLNVLYEFSREKRQLTRQPNLSKNQPKLNRFQFCTRHREIFGMNSVYGTANSSILHNFPRNKESCHDSQSYAKINHNYGKYQCTKLISLDDVQSPDARIQDELLTLIS